MTITAVSGAHTLKQAAGTTTLTAINNTGASLLTATVGWAKGGSTPVITDSLGNTWTKLTTAGPALPTLFVDSCIWYAKNPTVGASQTLTSTAAVNNFQTVTFQAWSGVDTTAPFDVENVGTGVTTTVQPGSVTPANAGSLIVSSMSPPDQSSGTVSINSGFTILDGAPYLLSTAEGSYIGYLIQLTAAAVNPQWSGFTAGATTNVAASSIAVFKSAAPPPANTNVPKLLLMGVG